MNPYDRRAVRALWSRVRPDRDVFAPGPWPGPPPMPPAGQGGKPPGERPSAPRPPDIPPRPPEQGALFAEVMALPEKYRTVLYLFYYEEYSVKEIAELLDVSPSVVTTRLNRARQALKSELTEVS